VRFRRIGAPSRLRLIRKTAALARMFETRDLRIEVSIFLLFIINGENQSYRHIFSETEVYYESIKRNLKIKCI